jgi:hypothetical protein
MMRAFALAVLWPTLNAVHTSAIVMYGFIDLSDRKFI